MTSHPLERYFVYVLISLKDERFYVGFTADLVKRFQEHKTGTVSSTKYRRPLKLIHYEYFINKVDAKSREVFLKSGFGRDQLRQSLKRTLKEIEQVIAEASHKNLTQKEFSRSYRK